jgi:hypothetical protein
LRGSYEQILAINLKRFEPAEAKKHHIRIAREVLNKFLGAQKEATEYKIFTDGVESASEESVKPFGVIRYNFLRMAMVGKYAIKTAQDLSPVQSGRYKRSWILVADGQLVNENNVPNNSKELILVNNPPYARKIHLRGARIRGVPPGIVEKTRLIVRRRFGRITDLNIRFISLHGGYKLKNDYLQTRKSGRVRLHTKAGTELTYPALVIRSRFG